MKEELHYDLTMIPLDGDDYRREGYIHGVRWSLPL